MSRMLSTLLVLLGLAAAAVYGSVFVVHQNSQALVTQFGNPVRVINSTKGLDRTPGLKWKIPLVETVEHFDRRVLDLDTGAIDVTAADQKRMVVDAFSRYKIVDPLEFFKTLHSELGVPSRLGPKIETAIRSVLATSTFQQIVREKREALMNQIRDQVNQESTAFGIEIVDVRIKRADLPEANREAVYKRMRAQRSRDANEYRAEGAATANRIRATADREATVIRANATRDADIMRGEGDAERNKIFAEAFGKDPEFFAFYRSMQAYEQGLKGGDTRMMLSPNGEFFRYFNDLTGKNKP